MRTRSGLIAAVLVGLFVRAPGVLWGSNFPTGWYGHHVDEYTHLVNAEGLINPLLPPRWPPHPYPKGLAAHVLPPLLLIQAAQGTLLTGLPSPQAIIMTGRIVSLLYGAATIVIVFWFAKRLFGQAEEAVATHVAMLSAWITALGGLHVSQSHFFVADVPALFWTLLGSYFLYCDVESRGDRQGSNLAGSGFCFGVAFGLKLVVAGLPSIAIAAVLIQPRIRRTLIVATTFVAGFVLVNADSYSATDLARTIASSGTATYAFSRMFSLLVYAIQLPSLISIPVLFLAIPGSWFLARKLFALEPGARRTAIWLAVILPQALTAILVVFTVNNFLRHLIPFIPWLAMVAAVGLVRIAGVGDASRRLRARLVVAPLFIYLAVFVLDGERLYINEPRNAAATWLLANVPAGTPIWWQGHGWITQYQHVDFMRGSRPPVLVVEMHRANGIVSGMGWKNSMPADYRQTFGRRPKNEVDALQGLFKGKTEYREVARFPDRHWMPEFTLVERLLGNRSRNYLSEVVVFQKGEANSLQAGRR